MKVQDRAISYPHPNFVIRKGEMHHKRRYDNVIQLSAHFYGENITETIPGPLLSCLVQLEQAHLVNTDLRIYSIVNCGFYEGVQAEYAIDVLQNWCAKSGFTWGAGVGIGCGGASVQIAGSKPGQGPRAPIDHALGDLAEKILRKQTDEKRYANIGFPRFIYKLGAQLGWRMEIKANDGKTKGLSRRLID